MNTDVCENMRIDPVLTQTLSPLHVFIEQFMPKPKKDKKEDVPIDQFLPKPKKAKKVSKSKDSEEDDRKSKQKRRYLRQDKIKPTPFREGVTAAYKLLVVNVGGQDYTTPSTEEQLVNDWFEDSASLSTQIAECSANKVTFSPKSGTGIVNGVTTVSLKRTVS